MSDAVQGYIFQTVEESSLSERNGTICKIIGRGGGDALILEQGPLFRVKFGDGVEEIVSSDELRPWFPVG